MMSGSCVGVEKFRDQIQNLLRYSYGTAKGPEVEFGHGWKVSCEHLHTLGRNRNTCDSKGADVVLFGLSQIDPTLAIGPPDTNQPMQTPCSGTSRRHLPPHPTPPRRQQQRKARPASTQPCCLHLPQPPLHTVYSLVLQTTITARLDPTTTPFNMAQLGRVTRTGMRVG